MELPSIIIWLLTAFSICEAVIATFFKVPKTSVNCIRINWMSSSLTWRMMSSFVYLPMRHVPFPLRAAMSAALLALLYVPRRLAVNQKLGPPANLVAYTKGVFPRPAWFGQFFVFAA